MTTWPESTLVVKDSLDADQFRYIPVDTIWYYRRAVDTVAISRALDSMIEIPGIWRDNDNPLKTLPEGAVYPSPNKLTIDPAIMTTTDSLIPGRQRAIWDEPPALYYLDPQTGYFHRPDGVYEAVPDSAESDNLFWIDSMGYPIRPVMIPTGTLVWRKVEEE
jgi:hypothetical protein